MYSNSDWIAVLTLTLLNDPLPKEDEVEEVAVEPEESMVLSPEDTAAPINPLSATLR